MTAVGDPDPTQGQGFAPELSPLHTCNNKEELTRSKQILRCNFSHEQGFSHLPGDKNLMGRLSARFLFLVILIHCLWVNPSIGIGLFKECGVGEGASGIQAFQDPLPQPCSPYFITA